MKQKGIYRLTSSAILLLLFFSSCRGRALSGNVEGFFHLYNEASAGQIVTTAELFTEEHPQVEIDVQTLPYQDMRRALLQFLNTARRPGR